MRAVQQAISAVLLCCTGGSVMAQGNGVGLGGGLKVGTPGVGIELVGGLTDRFALRGLINGGSFSRDFDESGIHYDGTWRFGTGFLLADWHPGGGAFRLSGGLAYNNQRLDGAARPGSGTININGVNYSSSSIGSLDGRLRFSKASPYVGLGWGIAPRQKTGLYFSADLGVMYQKPTATLTGSCGSALPAVICNQLQSDIRAEEAEFRNAADDFRFYPILSLGFGLRF
jgi:hypothetical protein